MNEESILKTVCICCTVVVCTLILSIAGYQAYQTNKIAQMVKGGANPIDVGCLLNSIPRAAEAFCHK